MTNQNFKDWKELFSYMANGLPVICRGETFFADEKGEYSDRFFFSLESYTKPLPPKEEWFEVTEKQNGSPYRHCRLYKGKEHFFHYTQTKESDYEWIKLVKVEI